MCKDASGILPFGHHVQVQGQQITLDVCALMEISRAAWLEDRAESPVAA